MTYVAILLSIATFNCVQKRAQIHLRTLTTKCVYKLYLYLQYMCKQDFALHNQQWLICHKTKPNQNCEWSITTRFSRGPPKQKKIIYIYLHILLQTSIHDLISFQGNRKILHERWISMNWICERGSCDVMVTVVGNGRGETSSNPGRCF